MLLSILTVIYILLAIGMIALILMQRGAGAQAGSGFGGGASATVFGSRGASNFLSKTTKWLAILFFVISLGMAWYATHSSSRAPAQQDLGLMGQVPATPAKTTGNTAVPASPSQQAPATNVPVAPVAPRKETAVPVAPPSPGPNAPQPPSGG
jgi:preprotein translocase subunit SecG